MIGTTVSHYRIVAKLGEGGMGVVYKAEDTRLKRAVALKLLPPALTNAPDAKERFAREARAASALDHPNICTIYEINETDDGQTFICMACYDGMTLQDAIDRGPLPIEDAVDIALQVARGLSATHALGIVHRDIKPANVFITDDRRVKIFDFGLAKLAGSTRLTRVDVTLGTLTHMSPEHVSGGDVDHRADIWALGVLLYEMVTGKLPFVGEHEPAVIYSIMNQVPAPMTGLRADTPPELEAIVGRCLQKNAADRYASADHVVAELARVVRAPAGPGVARAHRARRPGRRRLGIMLAAAVVVVSAYGVYSRFATRHEGARLASAPTRKMIVVLPFENLGPSDVEYFADGVTEEITNRLAALSGLGVISRTTAFQYKSDRKSVREIGKQLGVDYVLEGTVRWDPARGEGRVRITPQLIRVADDTHVWSEQYDKVLSDIFAVQSDIASRVSEKLNVALLGAERQALEARPTPNMDAYQAYLRGLDYATRPGFSLESCRLAIQMFARAVELDPDFALAYAALARAHSNVYNAGLERTQDHVAASKAAVDRALDLQPELPETRLALGYYYYHCLHDYDRALIEFEAVRDRLPSQSEALQDIGWIRRRQGHWDEALDYLQGSLELSPRDRSLCLEVGNTYLVLRRYDVADSFYDRVIAMAPDDVWGYAFKAVNYWLRSGDLAQARAVLERMPPTDEPIAVYIRFLQHVFDRNYAAALDQLAALSVESIDAPDATFPKTQCAGLVYSLMGESEDARASFAAAADVLEREASKRPGDARVHSSLGIVYAYLGRRDDAIREARRGVEMSPTSEDAMHGPKRVEQLAVTYLLLGETDSALDELERVLSAPAWISTSGVRIDPLWGSLRGNPRFAALVE